MRINDRAVIGGNSPPEPIEFIHDAIIDLSRFLLDTPVITDPVQAAEGALLAERCRKTLQDVEDARKAEVGPLNERVKGINERYKTARSPLETIVAELRIRLTDYTAREEARRIRIAEEQRLAAEAAEMEARRAEEAEREAKENATLGEITDVAAAVIEADQAFNNFQKLERAAAVAERDTTVRLPSQLGGRALSLKSKETLTVDNALKAIMEIGSHPKINEAILSAARDYRKRYGKLPAGVSATYSREI